MATAVRNGSVDVVRAVALVGICVVNVPFLGLPLEALFTPPEAPADRAVAFAVEALLQAKVFLLFSFVFGWGLHVQAQAAARAGACFGRRWSRRLAVLAVLGCLHAVFVFTGDILLLYALLGALVWPLRAASPRTLLRIAAAMVPVAAVCLASLGVLLSGDLGLGSAAGLSGSFGEATRARLADWPATFGFLLLFQAPLAFAAFAAGIAAGRLGVFEADSPHRRRLKRAVPLLAAVGVPLNLLYAAAMGGWLPPEYEGLELAGFMALAPGAPLLSAVYLSLLLDAADRVRLPSLVVTAGRNSLSVYVAQGVVAGVLFGGYGAGLFAAIGHAWLVPVALAVAAVAVTAVGLVAARFGRGPLEALLRRVTYA
ncbi:DUF418 domain-containing protein [Caenispirillum bisanense]|uniref:DUF418 domain-containing protein n=1 Tax=Caenispirillum bisanense TaxID=414052 RepID=A0A286GGB0_9PROT|nr:DUF418 domain-containing protein [Caenispirillum bisanense]SOD94563.1 uncharacterized protein SAMN05421508_10431 [Caenispirillum bisanense]